jgi:NADPH-dependent glutamate synthase beta subunit-like oxidoreductase
MEKECLQKEISRCLGCKIKPCEKACPLGVSPHDFIAAMKMGDYAKAASLIAAKNPMPETCGRVCPALFCQKVCIRGKIDSAVEIPCLQAMAIEKGDLPELILPQVNNKRVALIGGGISALGATYTLITRGFKVDIYEQTGELGGAARYIPEYRLPKALLNKEINRLVNNDRVRIFYHHKVTDFTSLQVQYDGVILAIGEQSPCTLGIDGENFCLAYKDFLTKTEKACENIQKIGIIGGGEVALDCALSAKKCGVPMVEMFVRRRQEDMRIGKKDFEELKINEIVVRDLTSVINIHSNSDCYDLTVIHNTINDDGKAVPVFGSESALQGYDAVVLALGAKCTENIPEGLLVAGDMTGKSGTVVEALASGMAAANSLMEKIAL